MERRTPPPAAPEPDLAARASEVRAPEGPAPFETRARQGASA